MFYGQSNRRGRSAATYRYTPRRRALAEPTPVEEWIDRGGRADVSLVKLGAVLAVAAAAAGPLLLGWAVERLVRRLGRAARTDKAAALRRHRDARRRLRRGNRVGRHPAPTPERLLELWDASRASLEAKLTLGAALGDLEATVDNAHIRDERGEVVGRKPGIRGWIAARCPALSPRYKTLMRYKALADKLRLAAADAATPAPAGDASPTAAPPSEDPATNRAEDPATRLAATLLGPAPAAGPTAPLPPARPGTARIRDFLALCRTLAALDGALRAALGLQRMRRGPRRAA